MLIKKMKNIFLFPKILLGILFLFSSTLGWIEVSKLDSEQWQSTVAFYDNHFLVGWTDTRDLSTDSSTNVYACRITDNGTVLDTWGIMIANRQRDEMVPKICTGISDWLVIWQEGC
jgi:hypothetical protein